MSRDYFKNISNIVSFITNLVIYAIISYVLIGGVTVDISERIKFYRKENGFTQKELGARINKSAQVISNWERGYTVSINQDDILNLANVFGVPVEKLVDKNSSLFESSLQFSPHNLPTLTPKESSHLQKYRALDDDGRELVDGLLDTLHEQRSSKFNTSFDETTAS